MEMLSDNLVIVVSDNEKYRKQTARYEWQTEFDRQKAEASTKITELYDRYSYEAVMAAMLDLIHDNISDKFREEYGREYGDDYLPPNPRHGIVPEESTKDKDSADNSEGGM
jgi:hypothetical protein